MRRTPFILCVAAAASCAGLHAQDRASVLRYASLRGNIRVELHMLPPVSTGPMSPSWSPDGAWIAFAMAGDIWRIPARGGTAEQLTQGPWYHFEPSWSPDGSRIVMTVETGRGLDIALLDVDGGQVSLLVEGGRADVQPSWSPDGRYVYFATAGLGMDVHRIEVATGEREAVADGPGSQYQPRVSPHGVLAFLAPSSGVAGSGGIWTRARAADGAAGQPVLVRAEETAYRARPDWLPDGSALVYVSDEAGSNDLVLISADGGNPLRLTGGTSHELTPRISPNGEEIAFVSNERGPTELHVMSVAGGARGSWRTLDVSDRRHMASTGRVYGRVLGYDEPQTPARVSIAASDGRSYAPRDGFHRVLTPTETHYFRTTGTFEVEVPAGPVTIQARKGLEFRPVSRTVEVPAGGRVEAVLQLDRLVDARETGWYSGDTHVHDLHQGRYGLTHTGFFNDLVSEDLRVSFALIHMDGTRLMGRWDDLTGRPHPLSTDEYILQYAQEFRGSFGHVGLAGVKEFIMPLVGGAGNTPFAADVLNADYLLAAREQGATGGFMHPFSGLVAMPEYIGVSEIPVDVALGVGDFYDVICFWYDELNNAEVYYRLLNAGFRLAATGGTDNFSDVWRDPGPGASRTYARVEGELSVDSWLEAVRERRTFATNGPLLFLTVDGVEPGGEIRVPGGGSGERAVVVEVATNSPLRSVEIVVNGAVAEVHEVAGMGERFRVESQVPLEGSGWIAARALGPPSPLVADSYAFAQTSPVWVVAGDSEYRSADDIRFLLEAVQAFRDRVVTRDRWVTPEDRERFLARVDEAVEVYQGLLRDLEVR
ncbi:MAG: CehA/McbA family metallohydrolase [Gemmatimonadota bacterium]|nr:CehA/McbA family metallohydrolase [Gemmatimonadota bacterium]